jgi:hypothetical protein
MHTSKGRGSRWHGLESRPRVTGKALLLYRGKGPAVFDRSFRHPVLGEVQAIDNAGWVHDNFNRVSFSASDGAVRNTFSSR